METKDLEQYIREWELTGRDRNDLKCVIGEHDMLRVERLGKSVWWFAVYIGEETFMSGQWFPHQSTKDAAKYMAESVYKIIISEREKLATAEASRAEPLLEALEGLVNDVKNKPNDTRYSTHLKIATEAISNYKK